MTFQEILLLRICTVNVWDKTGVEKYLTKSCYHRIECFATNSLATFMWRRPLNSIVLATPTHRGPLRVSDGTITQVRVQMIDKCKVTMASRKLYKKGSPHEERRIEKSKENRGTVQTTVIFKQGPAYIHFISSD